MQWMELLNLKRMEYSLVRGQTMFERKLKRLRRRWEWKFGKWLTKRLKEGRKGAAMEMAFDISDANDYIKKKTMNDSEGSRKVGVRRHCRSRRRRHRYHHHYDHPSRRFPWIRRPDARAVYVTRTYRLGVSGWLLPQPPQSFTCMTVNVALTWTHFLIPTTPCEYVYVCKRVYMCVCVCSSVVFASITRAYCVYVPWF